MILDSRILWSLLKTQNVTVSVTRQPDKMYLLFQVSQMADLGGRGQRLFLKPVQDVDSVSHRAYGIKKAGLSLPQKIGNLVVTYAGPAATPIDDAYDAIARIKGKVCIEKIVTDVLAPGDFVLFKTGAGGQVQFMESLRVMTVQQLMNHKPIQVAHAL